MSFTYCSSWIQFIKSHFRVIAFCDNLRDMSQKNIIPELVYLTLE